MFKHMNAFLLGLVFAVSLGSLEIIANADAQLYNPSIQMTTIVMQNVTHIGHSGSVSVNPGLIALGTKTVSVSGLTGLKANDMCMVGYASNQSITAGVEVTGCRATADGQVDIVFSTPLLAGVSLGAMNMSIGWFGP